MNFKITRTIKILAIAMTVSISGFVNAGLINPNFEDDLNGWQGAVDGIEYIDNITNFADYSDVFSVFDDQVTLSQSNDYWNVYLYQEFTFDSNAAFLSLDYGSTDVFGDEAYVTLKDAVSDVVLWDFYDGLSFDVSSLAASNQSVVLEFAMVDFDYFNDSLSVSNISVSTTSVPEPSAFAIFTLGLFALRKRLSLKA